MREDGKLYRDGEEYKEAIFLLFAFCLQAKHELYKIADYESNFIDAMDRINKEIGNKIEAIVSMVHLVSSSFSVPYHEVVADVAIPFREESE